ncbi:MAG: Na+/H+ antiporter [Cyclobacteriaceae bacterium]|nr:Na+/H+ antiporter [Cyclobacteriaceae bacterium]UYN85490.1 MAG: Na+/H+ antiporter [Cyclobacteriaceae bacterium]
MHIVEIVILLLAVVTALAEVTDKIRIPYPILLVLAGLGIGLIPGLPRLDLDPDIIFLLFLPPMLYADAWYTSWPDFKAARRPIGLLAVGCVIFTTCAIAWVAHTFIPGVGWPEAFVLGAIISPTDTLAATAATQGLNVPKRVVTIIQGESLVNDSTGLIAYRFAVAAVVTGAFSLGDATLQFFVVAGGGILIGLAIGYVFKWIHQITPDNATTDTTLTFITPFVCYLVADHLGLSAVLAVVACGLLLSRKANEFLSQKARVQAIATWDTVVFIMNGIIFILIGLQLPYVLDAIQKFSLSDLILYGLMISGAVILVRIIWVYPGAYIPRWLSKEIRERETSTNVKTVTIVAWSGIRGVVSLAAAMALPLTVANDSPFPNRDLIIFLTFSVIFATLVLQGLSLRPLIKWLGLKPDNQVAKDEEEARLRIASGLIEHIEENYSLIGDDLLPIIKSKYEIRIQRIRKDQSKQKLDDETVQAFLRIQRELVEAERKMVYLLRKEGKISEEVLRKIDYELDLEETRLILDNH